uniref:Tripartite motif containing 35, putative n=1 Tax=Fundulus heteroclitus TaxID=8078 RepID=A0A146ZRA2_FUNHE
MASKQREDLLCPVCHDIYRNPVILTCEHSFCIDCLKANWAERETTECPVCRRRSSLPPMHFALKMECDQVRASGSEPLCSLHAQKLSFFCVEEQQLACNVCRDSETHTGHRFQRAEDAGQESKTRLQESLKPLRKRLRLLHGVKGSCDQTADHITVQAESTAGRIKEEFRKLQRFLEEEEVARQTALREEKIGALSKEISTLSGLIRSTEKELKAQTVQFLLNYKDVIKLYVKEKWQKQWDRDIIVYKRKWVSVRDGIHPTLGLG